MTTSSFLFMLMADFQGEDNGVTGQGSPGSEHPLGESALYSEVPRCAPTHCLALPQLSEWWLKTAYLQYRQPVVIYSNPGLLLPKQDFVDLQGQLR